MQDDCCSIPCAMLPHQMAHALCQLHDNHMSASRNPVLKVNVNTVLSNILVHISCFYEQRTGITRAFS